MRVVVPDEVSPLHGLIPFPPMEAELAR